MPSTGTYQNRSFVRPRYVIDDELDAGVLVYYRRYIGELLCFRENEYCGIFIGGLEYGIETIIEEPVAVAVEGRR